MSRINLENRHYFVTSVTRNRRNLFSDPELAQIIVDEWDYYKDPHNFDLHAYAVMSDHYHVLIKLEGKSDISQILYSVNSYSTKLINEKLPGESTVKIWQGKPFDEVIRSRNMYYQKLAYILFNPWRADLVSSPFDSYEFSNLDQWLDCKGEAFVQDLFSKYKRWSE